jgi:hypothetical protein
MTTAKLPVKPLPLNFLLGCGLRDLDNFELARLADVADLRKELHAVLDRVIDAMSQAALAGWFKAQDRQALKHAIENEESPMDWARRMVRDKQRSAEELVPRSVMEPGATHLAAALRYQERNVAEGKCAVCPQPLAPHSVRFCERHVEMARLRKTPKGVNGGPPPGSVDWLYGEGLFEGRKGPTDLVKSRAKRAKRLAREAR